MSHTTETADGTVPDQVPRDALIRDLSIVLAGALHPSAKIGPGPRLAARRMQDVLSIPDGAPRSAVEGRLRAVLADDATASHTGEEAAR